MKMSVTAVALVALYHQSHATISMMTVMVLSMKDHQDVVKDKAVMKAYASTIVVKVVRLMTLSVLIMSVYRGV
jgi:hypothetical protein